MDRKCQHEPSSKLKLSVTLVLNVFGSFGCVVWVILKLSVILMKTITRCQPSYAYHLI